MAATWEAEATIWCETLWDVPCGDAVTHRRRDTGIVVVVQRSFLVGVAIQQYTVESFLCPLGGAHCPMRSVGTRS